MASTQVYFATNRDPDRVNDPTAFGKRFHRQAPDYLRYGWAEVGTDAIDQLYVAPEKLAKDQDKAKLGSREVFHNLMQDMQDGVDTIVYVHGYNVSYEEGMLAGAKLARAYRLPRRKLNVAVFTWPSDGSMMPFLAYRRDRADAAASGPAFGRALLKLDGFLRKVRRGADCQAGLHLVCHSMGNYVLRQGLKEVLRHGGPNRLFDHVFLMAADEDHDAFEHDYKLGSLPELAGDVNVYFNSGDTALVVSDKTKSNPSRLGSRGPRSPLTVPGNVTLVDASEVVGGLVEHDYYLSEPVVVRDVKAVLGGRPADKIASRRYVPAQNRYVLG